MRTGRCCPADCAVKSDWELELQKEIDFFLTNKFQEANNVLKDKQNLVSYNLGILKKHKMIDSYNRSKHKIYKLNENAIGIIKLIREGIIDK